MSYQSDNMAFNNAMDSLSHYGVKGMEWGKRNEETLRKYGLLGKAYQKDSTADESESKDFTGSLHDEITKKMLQQYAKNAFSSKSPKNVVDKIFKRYNNMRLSMALEGLSKSGLNVDKSQLLSSYRSAKKYLKRKGDNGIPDADVTYSETGRHYNVYTYRKKNNK